MRVTPLSARYIKDARANRESKQLDEARDFLAVALGREEKTVLTEIVGVEGRLPPLARFRQSRFSTRSLSRRALIFAIRCF